MTNKQSHLILLTIFIAGIFFAATWLAQSQVDDKLRKKTEESLVTVLNSAHSSINIWAEQEKATAMTWANSQTIREATIGLLDSEKNKQALIDNPYQELVRSNTLPILKTHGFMGYFIVNKDNVSIASSRNKNIGTQNLLAKQKHFIDMLWSGKTALSLPIKSDVPLPDKNGVMREGLPSMFAGAPIFDINNTVIAIFAFRINPYKSFTMILQQGRLGKSGETYAFNHEGRMISMSRFDSQLQAINLTGNLDSGEYFMVELRDPGVNLLEDEKSILPQSHQPLTQIVQSAIKEGKAVNMEGYRDYRGVTVFGASLWDENLHLGISTEIDADEAYEVILYSKYIISTLYVISVISLVALLLIFLISRKSLLKSSREISNILQNSPVAMVITDETGNIKLFNHKFIEQFGWTKEDIKSPEEWWSAAYPDASYRKKVQNSWEIAIQKANNSGCEIAPQTWNLTCKNGDIKIVEFNMLAISEQINVIAMHDITSIKQAEKERRQIQKQLLQIQKNNAISLLSGGVAHHFNNLLTSIIGYTSLAEQKLPAQGHDELEKYLNKVMDSSYRARDLIKQVQNFSRTAHTDKKQVKLHEIIPQSLEIMLAALPSKIELNTQLEETPTVLADSNQLQQVVINLVANASDAMNGDGTIDINVHQQKITKQSCSSCNENFTGDYVVLEVRDAGEGINRSTLNNIFDPFFTTREVGKGVGMGLSVAHGIIHDHNGHIHIESRPGKGTRICFYLPVDNN